MYQQVHNGLKTKLVPGDALCKLRLKLLSSSQNVHLEFDLTTQAGIILHIKQV